MVTKDTKTYSIIARILFTAISCLFVLATIEVIATIAILWLASPVLKDRRGPAGWTNSTTLYSNSSSEDSSTEPVWAGNALPSKAVSKTSLQQSDWVSSR